MFFRNSVLTRATRRNMPVDGILHSHRRENLNSYTALCWSQPKNEHKFRPTGLSSKQPPQPPQPQQPQQPPHRAVGVIIHPHALSYAPFPFLFQFLDCCGCWRRDVCGIFCVGEQMVAFKFPPQAFIFCLTSTEFLQLHYVGCNASCVLTFLSHFVICWPSDKWLIN
jgi:hypothetical protein